MLTPNAVKSMPGSENARDKLRVQKGNSPDRQLRSLILGEVEKEVRSLKQPGGWLRGSHPLKSA